jgi:predicted DNA-binding transcriptional regulator YafY
MPVVTFPGNGGGIGILPGYTLDKRLLSKRDMAAIGAALAGLTTIGGDRVVKDLFTKLIPEASGSLAVESDIIIDFSGWDSHSYLLHRIQLLRRCIAEQTCVKLDYLSASGRDIRVVEPGKIIFKSNSWYLYGWCRLRKGPRMFKLSRMAELLPTEDVFKPRELPDPLLTWEVGEPANQGEQVRLRFPAKQEYLAVDLFGAGSYNAAPSGELEAVFYSTDLDGLLAMILSMGAGVEVLEPDSLREKVTGWAKEILARYGSTE